MNKYIRTKDGIYEVVGFDDECIIPSPIIKMNGKLTHCSSYKNCKQSENIEELCDRFVVIDKETKEVMNIVAFWEYAKHWVSWKYNIYGAIWTEKGLIFVAKMNEDGVLCLI